MAKDSKKDKENSGKEPNSAPDTEATETVTGATVRDQIEVELVRHEKAFEDFIGGLCTSEPEMTPMSLHNRRLEVLRCLDAPERASELPEALALLSEVQFIYPTAAVPAAEGDGTP